MNIFARGLSKKLFAEWARYLIAFAYTETNECRMATSVPVFTPLGRACVYPAWCRPSIYPAWCRPSIYPAWRGPSVYPAWRDQYLRRLAGPVFIPLGGASVYPAWRSQCLSHLAGPVFIPLGAGPVFIPLGRTSVYPAWRGRDDASWQAAAVFRRASRWCSHCDKARRRDWRC